MRILLIGEQSRLANEIALKIKEGGYEMDRVTTIADAINAFDPQSYALTLLDRRLPDGDGLSLVPQFRKSGQNVRIILLTDLDAVDDRIAGLDAGADDCLTKPLHLDELMARVRAHLRSQSGNQPHSVSLGKLTFDFRSRAVAVANVPAVLLRRELSLLETLIAHANSVVPRETLSARVYGFGEEVQEHALTVLVSRLRYRLEELDAGVEIHAARGLGYRIGPAKAAARA